MSLSSNRVGERFIREVVETAKDGLLSINETGEVVFANARAQDVVGFEPDELVGMGVSRLFPAKDSPYQWLVGRASRSEDAPTNHTESAALRHADGSEVHVGVSVQRIEYDDQEFITLRFQKTNGHATREGVDTARDRLSAAFENSPNPVLVIDPLNDELRGCNSQACEFLDYRRDELRSVTPSDVHDDDSEGYEAFVTAVLDNGVSSAQPVAWETRTGDVVEATTSGYLIEVEKRPQVLAIIEKGVSEASQGAAEVEGRQRSLLFERSCEPVVEYEIREERLVITDINAAFTEVFGYTREEAVGNSPRELLVPASEADEFEQLVEKNRQGGFVSREVTRQTKDGERDFLLRTRTFSLGGKQEGYAFLTDISEFKQHQRTLRELQEFTRDLTEAEDVEAIAERALEGATDMFGVDIACVRLVDPETNGFERVATTEAAESLVETQPAFDLDATRAGQAYRQSELVTNEWPETSPEFPIEQAYHLPIRGHGTLSLLTAEGDTHALDAQHGQMLADSIGAALERAKREDTYRKKQEELEQQKRELETLDRVNALVRELVYEMMQAPDRKAIEDTVCEQLVQSDLYDCAWVGGAEIGNKNITPRTHAGLNPAYFEALQKMPASQMASGTVAEAIETGEIEVIRQYQSDETGYLENGAAEAAPEGAEAVAAIPLKRRDHTYGVLVLSTSHERVFNQRAVENLEMLGETVGFAIHAVRSRELLQTDNVIQLEFEVTNPDCLAVHVSERCDCHCRIKTTERLEARQIITYLRFEGAPPEEVKTAVSEMDVVEESRVVRAKKSEGLVEVIKKESATSVLRDAGAQTKHATATEGHGRIVAEVSPDANLREIAQSFEEGCPGYDLIAKREVDKTVQTTDEFQETIENELTDKQQTAINAAFASGYYDWPRETTAEELADSLGITSSTLHQHLRKAEQKILDQVITEAESRPRPSAD